MLLLCVALASAIVIQHAGDGASDQLPAAAAVAAGPATDEDDDNVDNYHDNDDDADKPIFRPSPTNITVSPGDRASLKCRVDNLGTKTVIWRRYEDVSPLTIGLYPFAADARISVDYNLRTSEWTLLIQDVRPSDEGLYHCQVSTKDASEHMYNVQLNVNTIQVSGSEYVEYSSPVQLMCNATGRPDPPHNVDWYKEGRIVHSDVKRGVIVTKKIETKLLVSVLSIRSARLSDAGQYVCLSSDQESASIKVHVLSVPAPVGKRGTSPEHSAMSRGTAVTWSLDLIVLAAVTYFFLAATCSLTVH